MKKIIIAIAFAAVGIFAAPQANAGTSPYEAKSVVVGFIKAFANGNTNCAKWYVVQDAREIFTLIDGEGLRDMMAREAGGSFLLKLGLAMIDESDCTIVGRGSRKIHVRIDLGDEELIFHLRAEGGDWKIYDID